MARELELVKSKIRNIPDFPIPGILFRDITPVLQDPEAFAEAVGALEEFARDCQGEAIVAIEARGYILAAPIALRLGVPFIPVRKKGKLPAETVAVEYSLEYGTATIEMHRDALKEGQRAVLLDDLLATGGTARAAAQLIEKLGAQVAGIGFLIELTELGGRRLLEGYRVESFVKF